LELEIWYLEFEGWKFGKLEMKVGNESWKLELALGIWKFGAWNLEFSV
jgi:hypothetical protein